MQQHYTAQQISDALAKNFGSLWPEKTLSKEKIAGFGEKVYGWPLEQIASALSALQRRHPDTLPSAPELVEAIKEVARDIAMGRKRETGAVPVLAEDFDCRYCGGGGSYYAAVWWNNWQVIRTARLVRHAKAVFNGIAVASLPCVCAAGDVYCSARVGKHRRGQWMEAALPGCWTEGLTALGLQGKPLLTESGDVVKNDYYLSPSTFGWMFVECCTVANKHPELFDRVNDLWMGMERMVVAEAQKPEAEQNLVGWERFCRGIGELSGRLKAQSAKSAVKSAGILYRTREEERQAFRERGGVMSSAEFRI